MQVRKTVKNLQPQGIMTFIRDHVLAVISFSCHIFLDRHEECEEKLKACDIVVGNKRPDGSYETFIKSDRECVEEVDLECPGKIISHQYSYTMKIVEF